MVGEGVVTSGSACRARQARNIPKRIPRQSQAFLAFDCFALSSCQRIKQLPVCPLSHRPLFAHSVFAEFGEKRLIINLEPLGGLRLVASVILQNSKDMFFLSLFERTK